MGKIKYSLIFAFLSIGVVIFFPKSIFGFCGPKPPRGNCSAARPVSCGSHCCETASECNGTQLAFPLCSAVGGCYSTTYTCERELGQQDCLIGYKCGVHCSAPTPTPTSTTSTVNTDLWCDSDKTQLNTAIGCIPILTTKEAFLGFILKWAVGIGGGIAFLLIIYAGFMIITSAGNPERLKAGQELLTSAISGLILLIFSVVILKIIGVDILGLCKFGFGPPC